MPQARARHVVGSGGEMGDKLGAFLFGGRPYQRHRGWLGRGAYHFSGRPSQSGYSKPLFSSDLYEGAAKIAMLMAGSLKPTASHGQFTEEMI